MIPSGLPPTKWISTYHVTRPLPRAVHHLLRHLLPLPPGEERLPDLQAERLAERRRHGVADLAVLVPDGAGELEVVAGGGVSN